MSAGRTVPRWVELHIGLMKSGTTFVQQLLSHHRDALADAGVLFPGEDYARQVAGVRDLVDLRGPLTGAELDGAWSALQAEIARWEGGTAIISVEHLSLARTPQIRTLVDSLAPARVHVVITARDMSRVLPSSWQETVQNGLTWTWDDFAASVIGAPAGMSLPAKRFWRQHGLLDIIDRWSRVLGTDHVRVVTVPREGALPTLLWGRFCAAVGIDADRYSTADFDRPANTSLDRDAAELLRLLNERLGDRLGQAEYVRYVKRPLAKRALTQLPSTRPITLSADHLAWAVRHGQHVVAGLEKRAVPVTGDLSELVPPADAVAADSGGPYPEPADGARLDRVADMATIAAHALIRELVTAGRGFGGADEPTGRRPPEVDQA